MRGISVKQAAEIVNGKLYGTQGLDSEILGVTIDSRKVENGYMFAALKGEHVDGHDYIGKAFELGAVCCIAEKLPEDISGTVIIVPDVAAALKILAENYRKRLDIPVIGIAGSVGKTTAKEMIASVLSQKYNVLKTEKNLNNELGVPLTIFRIEPEHEVAVIEMGISDFGEMSRLAKMVRPTMAVYTLIGHAHLERLHDRNGVLKAKAEMLDFMPDDGTVFLNADDDLLAKLDCRQNKVLYGTKDNADVKAENILSDSLSGLSCDIVSGDRRIPVKVPSYGSHMVYAALEGAAVGLAMGLSNAQIAAGIAAYETVGRRANVCDTGFITLIDDCYNANPDSVMCAVDSLKSVDGRKVCILGDMLEMGENKAELHAKVGKYASDNGVDMLLTVGELSKNTCTASEEISSLHFDTNAELITELPELIEKGDTVLVKASHSMKFDEISDALKLLK
ncbi:MAG: UDP-N-acetylmuramoyl-tripeptide--D-alanyl-D-alanine ligase [Oscillospiraceae bacterium]|nr:UDP-N-acetylmuramoyl-tripeptide--D-alanyl-D-alanine ligase [Oscillospiraceae bacterium]